MGVISSGMKLTILNPTNDVHTVQFISLITMISFNNCLFLFSWTNVVGLVLSNRVLLHWLHENRSRSWELEWKLQERKVLFINWKFSGIYSSIDLDCNICLSQVEDYVNDLYMMYIIFFFLFSIWKFPFAFFWFVCLSPVFYCLQRIRLGIYSYQLNDFTYELFSTIINRAKKKKIITFRYSFFFLRLLC